MENGIETLTAFLEAHWQLVLLKGRLDRRLGWDQFCEKHTLKGTILAQKDTISVLACTCLLYWKAPPPTRCCQCASKKVVSLPILFSIPFHFPFRFWSSLPFNNTSCQHVSKKAVSVSIPFSIPFPGPIRLLVIPSFQVFYITPIDVYFCVC